jgi:poly(A) polymerase
MARAADPARARSAATAIVQRLRDAGHTALFAGGCVRDELLGLAPTDYDIATDAVPMRVRELFPRSDAVGAAFGVVLVHTGGGATGNGASGGRAADGAGPERVSVEVATFRADGPYSDARRPDSIVFSDPRTDALRRDFTVNALFLDPLAPPDAPDAPTPVALTPHAPTAAPSDPPARGHIIDYVGGRADLNARVIRAVGDPDQRLREDHLRALRAVRFCARLGFTLDPATADAIRRHAAALKGVSRERIGDEIRRMLAHPSRAEAVDLLASLGLDAATFDEARTSLTPGHPRLRALSGVRAEPLPLPLALAAWLADRSTPAAEPFAPGKPTRAALVARARRSLCLSNDECDGLANILGALDNLRDGWLAQPVARQKRSAARPGFAEALDLLAAEASLDAGVQSGTVQTLPGSVRARVKELASTPGGVAPPPLIAGDDLIALGMKPGPGFKGLLERLYDEQLEGRLTSRQQGMELAKAWCV